MEWFPEGTPGGGRGNHTNPVDIESATKTQPELFTVTARGPFTAAMSPGSSTYAFSLDPASVFTFPVTVLTRLILCPCTSVSTNRVDTGS